MRIVRILRAGLGGAVLATLAAGCGGGGGNNAAPDESAKPLFVVDISNQGLDSVSLNVPFDITFSDFVKPDTIRPDTVQIRLGPRFGVQAFGDFRVSGEKVTFFPRLPVKADLSDSGLRAQSQYRVTVVGYPKVDRVNSYSGRALVRTFTGSFATAASTSPALFSVDSYKDPPPPAVLFTNPPDVLPAPPYTAPGGAQGAPTDTGISAILTRVPLRPDTVSTTNVTLTMVSRLGVLQGRPILGTPVLEQNYDSVRLSFVPTFPLADQARYALRISNRVQDLTGQYDVADNSARASLRSQADSAPPGDPLKALLLAYPEEFESRVFLIFHTRDEPQKDLTTVLGFDGNDRDQDGGIGVNVPFTTASFNSAVPGAVAAQFTAAGGNGTLGDFSPSSSTTISTNSPSAVNGQFNYQTFNIPSGVTVTVTGTVPATFLALKTVTISGVLKLTGGVGTNGEASYTTSSMPPAAGGAGGPGSGKGGDAFTGTAYTKGDDGLPGPNSGGGGGKGGIEPSTTIYGFGGGGGGGGHSPAFPATAGGAASYPSYSSWNGAGGAAGAAGGIQPTSVATSDGRNFPTLGVGAGGGGAGGNSHYYPNNWHNGAAGGGGGGGAVLVKGASTITVASSGRIEAMGGKGGDCNSTAYNYGGGAGGGGGGGSIALYANTVLTVTNGRLDTSGGAGGIPYSGGFNGGGGKGAGGYIQLEDADGSITGTSSPTVLTPDYSSGTFNPTSGPTDAASVYTSTWFNLGVFDAQIQPWTNADFIEQNYTGDYIKYEIQMAVEDRGNFGFANASVINPVTGFSSDVLKASQWLIFRTSDYTGTPTVTNIDVTPTLNGKAYQFFRLRISFTQGPGQTRTAPLAYVDRVRIRSVY